MIVQVRCTSCGLNDNVEIENIKEIEKLTCEVCNGALKLVQELTTIKLNDITVLKPETLELTFSTEETEQFPILKNGNFKLPKDIQLRPHNPECKLKEAWCITTKDGKKACLKLLHEAPKGDYKELFDILACKLEPEQEVNETYVEEIGE